MNKNMKLGTILMTLAVGGIAGHNIDDLIEKYNLEIDRYPIPLEYNIIDNCLSNYNEPISRSIYSRKKDVCICALGKTELAYSYEEYKLNDIEFFNIFEEKAKECM